MNDETKCTEIGCMAPARVVQCAEGSDHECWIAATVIAEDGSEVANGRCGGGKKARFSLIRRAAAPRPVSPDDVPSSLSWVHRAMV